MKLICASCGARFEFEAQGTGDRARCPACHGAQLQPHTGETGTGPQIGAAIGLDEWAKLQPGFDSADAVRDARPGLAGRPLVWVVLALLIGSATAWALQTRAAWRTDAAVHGEEDAVPETNGALTRSEAESVVARAAHIAAAHADGASAGTGVAGALHATTSELAITASTRATIDGSGRTRRARRGAETRRASSSRLAALAPPSVADSPVVEEASAELFAEGLRTFVQDSVARCRHRHEVDEGPLSRARVELTIDVGPDGRVVDVSSGRGLNDTAFGRCIATHSGRWRFPAFEGNVVTLRKTFVVQ